MVQIFVKRFLILAKVKSKSWSPKPWWSIIIFLNFFVVLAATVLLTLNHKTVEYSCQNRLFLQTNALSMQSLLLWYQIWRQIIFKREEESLASSLLNIICYQNWYQSKSDYMDRAFGFQKGQRNWEDQMNYRFLAVFQNGGRNEIVRCYARLMKDKPFLCQPAMTANCHK